MCAHQDYVYPIPDNISNEHAAPLLCAGAIGYRSLKLCHLENGQRLGLTGFGASGHQVLKLARFLYPDSEYYVFARSEKEQDFAKSLGAHWVGDTSDKPPLPLHAIIDTTPAWKPVLSALHQLLPGGRLVINAIRKQDHDKKNWLALSYAEQLWLEKEIKSVANITPADVREFLAIAAKAQLLPEYQVYSLEHANEALLSLKTRGYSRSKSIKNS